MAQRELRAIDTVIKAAAHQGAGRETEYRIAGFHQLVLAVQKTGAKSWRFYYSRTENGRRQKRKVALGSYPATTLAMARARAAELAERVEREGDVVAKAQVERETATLTLAAFIEEVLAEQSHLVSASEKRRELERDLVPVLGAMLARDVTAEDIDGAARKVVERGSQHMARRLIRHTKSIFNWALLDRPALAKRYGITTNPAASLGRARGKSSAYGVSVPRKRVLEDAELEVVLPALLRAGIDERTRSVLLLQLITAQRHGEIRLLRPKQLRLDRDEPLWIIPAAFTKSRAHDHAVPLSPLAARIARLSVERMSPSSEWVFPDPHRPTEALAKGVPPMAVMHFRRVHTPTLSPYTPHDLRRSAATGMRRLGVPAEIVSLILNHARQDVTGKHYDLYEALPERRDALNLWAAHLEKLGLRI